jgi:diguanylate cyclase (GGDEF)-like protein/PAS domain S-box-containing protein
LSPSEILEHRLQQSEARLRLLMDSEHACVKVVAPDGTLTDMNRAGLEILGLEHSDEAIGQPVVGFLHPEDRPRFWSLHSAALAGHSGHLQFRVVRRDGGERWMDSFAAPLHEPDGSVSAVLSLTRDITERRQEELLLRHRAEHDDLTDLPNRAHIHALLLGALRDADTQRTAVGVVLINLDHLHEINDTLGHDVGDRVIVQATQRIARLIESAGGRVGRLDGDDFLVVLPDTPGEGPEALAERLVAALGRAYDIDGHQLHITASAGTCACRGSARTPAALIANADLAVKKAKASGRNQVARFTDEMAAALAERVQIGSALRAAIGTSEMQLHFQPLVDAGDGRIRAAEALLRWTSPHLGVVSPARFIPVAEDSGLIVRLGDWVLRHALLQARACGVGTAAIPVSVNVSAVQFRRPEFLHEVADALRASSMEPASLKLEITESVVMEDAQQAINLLRRLRLLGVRVSLDDFGTGHSSLAYLRQLPIDEIKIDRVFIDDIGSDPYADALCRAIIGMSHQLRLSVVAEGVETPAQAAFLREAGCHLLQGYLFSPALPAAEFARIVRGNDAGRSAGAPQRSAVA